MTDVRVLVVDDQRLIRDSIASLLDVQPDVVLMDVRMPASWPTRSGSRTPA